MKRKSFALGRPEQDVQEARTEPLGVRHPYYRGRRPRPFDGKPNLQSDIENGVTERCGNCELPVDKSPSHEK